MYSIIGMNCLLSRDPRRCGISDVGRSAVTQFHNQRLIAGAALFRVERLQRAGKKARRYHSVLGDAKLTYQGGADCGAKTAPLSSAANRRKWLSRSIGDGRPRFEFPANCAPSSCAADRSEERRVG